MNPLLQTNDDINIDKNKIVIRKCGGFWRQTNPLQQRAQAQTDASKGGSVRRKATEDKRTL